MNLQSLIKFKKNSVKQQSICRTPEHDAGD